ncbi:putative disease resistance protein RGA3 [Phalaenopsis equestris]|uniref:putative disease resistance protein RGA3 n=1 Tax=Phalaenopsis equestris TaxID=78828 RepID=UPI0009E3E9E2|nr:putative disease resistance protein RGA3 [Phalaenopsis equestris]
MADWIVGPVMDKIINACFDYLQDQYRWQMGVKEELERLRENHPKVQAVVSASTQAQIRDRNPSLNSWIWQLRDAIDEAADVLDEFEYMKHKEQLTRNKKQQKVRSTMSSLKKIGKRALKLDPSLKRLEKVVKKLDKVSAEVSTFLHLLVNAKQEQQEQELQLCKARETGSLPKTNLIGRGKDKDFVMQWLRKPTNEDPTHITSSTLYKNISFLSIVGHGGMGKTTLLQHIFEDVKEEFDLNMWVCVSNDFDAKKVIVDMLECLKKERPRLESLAAVQESLETAVRSKRFLLVLDDIWEEDMSKWENVLSTLTNGSSGSKIVITTRMDSVASMIAKVTEKKKETLRIKGLEEDVCLKLLNTHAFAGVENHGACKKLTYIASLIVKKLSGSPLATKIIGGVLNSNLNESYWMSILNSDIGSTESELGQNNILSILRLSYTVLPKPLQNCFAFCSIFPNDHKFDKDDLVRMWIALGFIQAPPIAGETMEDIGGRYFNNLVKKSLFDEFQTKYETYYKMHDLLHELVQSVSAEECSRFMENKELPYRIPKTIRHLFISTKNLEMLKMIKEFKYLHSLFLIYHGCYQDITDALPEVFKATKGIRLLFISSPFVQTIPEAIENLIHLRYLNFDKTMITRMPRSLSKLYHLQFIIYKRDWESFDDFLPFNMSNLSNLRYLQLPQNVFSKISGIGKLRSLQELGGFTVKNENGYKIGELEHMSELRRLRIQFLGNVKDAEEACTGKLCEKRKLTDLSLDWGSDNDYELNLGSGSLRNIIDPDLDVNVLENLQPYQNLKRLSIRAYMGVRSALWMYDTNLTFNLEYIQLEECLEWETLPPFGQLPYLKSLCLHNMPKAKRLDNKFCGNGKVCVFPSLQLLHISKLEVLEEWFDAAGTEEDDWFFPCLTELWLEDCPNLLELPYLPPKLNQLKVRNIGWKDFNWLQDTGYCRSILIQSCGNFNYLRGDTTENFKLILNELTISDPSVLLMAPLRSITSLEKLTIEDNDMLVSFTNEVEQWFLQVSASLCVLNFRRLKSLQSLPSSLESLSSLKVLRVEKVPQLQLLSNIPPSMEQLYLKKLESLQCLPSSLSAISFLKHLSLRSIVLLKSLPVLPPSLRSLWLEDLDELNCLPSCLPSLSSLHLLSIKKVLQLRELPELPPSLRILEIKNCHQELMQRYNREHQVPTMAIPRSRHHAFHEAESSSESKRANLERSSKQSSSWQTKHQCFARR